ncbi:MAG: glycosyltransferase [Cellvibrionales bacterium]|nr:glycosyltransferase [Cellvibrionales bacterium]
MHCLVIASWFPNSANPLNGIFFQEQARALKEAGITIGLVTPYLRSIRESGPWLAWHPVKQSVHGYPVYAFEGRNWFPRPRGLITPWFRHRILKRLIRDYIDDHGRPDIVHAHSAVYLEGLAEILSELSLPYVITEHCSVFITGNRNARERQQANAVFQGAKKVISVGKGLKAQLEKDYPVISGKSLLIPNIVNQGFFDQPLLETESETFRFICVGFLRKIKGQEDLIRAFWQAFSHNPSVCLDLVGDGLERARLERLVAELGLTNQVTFHGLLGQSQVMTLLQQSDAFVLASHNETFGVAIVEAFASGLPVVATRTLGASELVNASNGYLSAPQNPDDLSVAMKKMVASIDRFDSYQLRNDCYQQFSEYRVTQQLIHLYQQVIDNQ